MRTLTCLLLVLVSALAAAGDPVVEYHKPDKPALPPPPPPGPPCHEMICPHIWDPVCGCTCDSIYCRTFSSLCHLRDYNCHNTPDYNFIRNGTCDQCPHVPVKGPEKTDN